jgi:hypothetical protein
MTEYLVVTIWYMNEEYATVIEWVPLVRRDGL